jgi:serine/threonine protein kinase
MSASFGNLQPGSQIDDLIIERKVGEGAMANLYLAVDSTGQERVIKVPCQSLSADPVSAVAFENEMRLASYLADFEYGCVPHVDNTARRPYLSMSYIRGQDLWSHLKQHGPLSEAATLALGIQIVHAVSQLHRRRIVHLDLKLSNIMLTPEHEVRLIDFGLANHLDLPDLIFESFRGPKGTPAYIAPEQFIGIRNEPRSDLYSVGVMLFELATGKLPFGETNSEADVVQRINSRPSSPRHYRPELSVAFEQIVARCLLPNPDDRFASMEALGDALKLCSDELACSMPAANLPVPAGRQKRQTRLFSLLSVVGRYFPNRWWPSQNNFYEVELWAAQRRSQSGPRVYRVLAALNLNRPNEAHHRAILQQALQHARTQPNAYLTIMSVVQCEAIMSSGEKETAAMNSAVATGRQQIHELLCTLDTQGVTINVNVMADDRPIENIRQHTGHYAVDLLVIGCRPKNPLATFVHGRTGYSILTSVQCNVFIVHAPAARLSAHVPAVAAAVSA